MAPSDPLEIAGRDVRSELSAVDPISGGLFVLRFLTATTDTRNPRSLARLLAFPCERASERADLGVTSARSLAPPPPPLPSKFIRYPGARSLARSSLPTLPSKRTDGPLARSLASEASERTVRSLARSLAFLSRPLLPRQANEPSSLTKKQENRKKEKEKNKAPGGSGSGGVVPEKSGGGLGGLVRAGACGW